MSHSESCKMVKVVGLYEYPKKQEPQPLQLTPEEMERLENRPHSKANLALAQANLESLANPGPRLQVVWKDEAAKMRSSFPAVGRGPQNEEFKLTENLQFPMMEPRIDARREGQDVPPQQQNRHRERRPFAPTHAPDGRKYSIKEREWLSAGKSLDPPVVVYGPKYFTHHERYRPEGPLYLLENGRIACNIKPGDEVPDYGLSEIQKSFLAERRLIEGDEISDARAAQN